MPDQELASPLELPAYTTQINRIANRLGQLGDRRPSHLLNQALAVVKHTMLYGDTHNIRLQAAKVMLEIPTIKRLAGDLKHKPRVRDLHQHVHIEASPEQKALEEKLTAMLSAGGPDAQRAIEALGEALDEPNSNKTETNE